MKIDLIYNFSKFDNYTIRKIVDKICHAYQTKSIEVNDGEGDKEYNVSELDTGRTLHVHLVLEEDGSVNWYFHPSEHSDLLLVVLKVCALKNEV